VFLLKSDWFSRSETYLYQDTDTEMILTSFYQRNTIEIIPFIEF